MYTINPIIPMLKFLTPILRILILISVLLEEYLYLIQKKQPQDRKRYPLVAVNK